MLDARWHITLLGVVVISLFAVVMSQISAANASLDEQEETIYLPAVYFPQPEDADSDGLTFSVERQLGTDPNNIDSDCDMDDDHAEIGSIDNPTDSDGDGIIDALESSSMDSNGNGIDDENDPSTSPQLVCGYFQPFAIAGDYEDRAIFQLTVVGGTNVTEVRVQLNAVNRFELRVDDISVSGGDYLWLYDDGTHGDRNAEDGIWTRGNFTGGAAHYTEQGGHSYIDIQTVKVTDAGTVWDISPWRLGGQKIRPLIWIDPQHVMPPTKIAENVFTSTNSVNIVDPHRSLLLRKESGLSELSHEFYQYFNDGYDFLLFSPTRDDAINVGGYYQGVQNKVENIGAGIYDSTAQYGSGGRLQGAIYLHFNIVAVPMLHELMHRWATPDLTELGFHQCADTVHWGIAGVGTGYLGGFDPTTLIDNGDGTYSADSWGQYVGDTYVPLELYLAGIVDADSVPSIPIPKDVDCGSLEYEIYTDEEGNPQARVTFSAAGLRHVTIQEVMNVLGGERSPDFQNSQHDFAAAWVIVSEYPLSMAELAFFNQRAKLLGAAVGDGYYESFEEATLGIATMDTRISP